MNAIEARQLVKNAKENYYARALGEIGNQIVHAARGGETSWGCWVSDKHIGGRVAELKAHFEALGYDVEEGVGSTGSAPSGNSIWLVFDWSQP